MGFEDIKWMWGALVIAAGGLFTGLKWAWKEYKSLKGLDSEGKPTPIGPAKNHILNKNHGLIQVYKQLSNLQYETGAGKVLLCRCHNGGGAPKLYISAPYEVTSSIAPGDGWEYMKMDLQYHTMVEDMYLHKVLVVETKDVEDGIFKSGMQSVGANTAVFAEVLTTDKDYVFLCCIFKEPVTELRVPGLEYHLKVAATKTKTALMKHPYLLS